MTNKKNLAIIGYGGQGGWHADHALTSDVVNLCGIYDILPARREVARSKSIHAYETLEELLADPQVELVTIATPNDTHFELVKAALLAGKHVICEKPVEMELSRVEEMIELAQAQNRLFTVHQNRRWDVDFLAIRQIIQSGKMGETLRIESRIHGSRGIPSDWRGTKEHGGGMILDWGVHLIDQMLQLVPQDVISVFCTVTNVTNEEVDDGFSSVLTFSDGLTARVEVGTSNFINLPRWYIQGQNGTAVIEDFKMNGEIVKVSDWENRDAVPVVTAAGLTKTMAPRTEETIQRYPLPRVESDVRDYYRNMADVINGKAPQIVTHKEMLRVMRVIEAMMWSAKNNEVFHGRI